MKKVFCKDGDHFSHYECSKCGQVFSLLWPQVGSAHWNQKKAKYCGNCGHQFIKPNSATSSQDMEGMKDERMQTVQAAGSSIAG